MIDLDLKDRKILYELDFNSRQSYRAIGKKVGLSKDIVSNRIEKLKENGVIRHFSTNINLLKLDYNVFRFYFKYQYISTETKNEIINYLVNNDFCSYIYSIDGSYDLILFVITKNISEFYDFWNKTLIKYGDYFAEKVFALYIREIRYRPSFLINEKVRSDTTIREIKYGVKTDHKVDELDLKILRILDKDGRIPTIDIAKKIKVNTKTIQNRINQMMNSGIIQGFHYIIDYSKIGYNFIKVDIFLKERSKVPSILKYMESNPNFTVLDRSIGYADLELEFQLKNIDDVHKIVENISKKFPNIIRNYKYLRVLNVHKSFFIP